MHVLYKIILTISTFSFSIRSFSQTANDILGVWLTETKEAKVTIYKQDNRYYGRITWLKKAAEQDGTPITDSKNRIKSLKTRPLAGILILDGFVFDKNEKIWTKGRVYDPTLGRSADATLTLKDNSTLKVKGYSKISWISKSEIWTKSSI